MPTLYTREGRAVAVRDGVASTLEPRACSRCGGAGGAQKWPGWTCFDCQGNGQHINGPRVVKLYTAEKLEKLNTARDKVRARKAAKRAAAAEKREAEAASRRDEIVAAYPDLVAWLQHSNEIVSDIGRRCIERAVAPSEKQSAAVASILARIAERAAAEAAARSAPYLGKVGERIGVSLRLERTIQFVPRVYWERASTLFLFVEPTTGARAAWLTSGGFDRGIHNGETIRVRATVKEQATYKEIPQTKLTRAKLIEETQR